MKILFLLIDALNLIRRIYEAQPANESPEQMKGALATCGRSFQRAISEARPTHAACIFDGDGPSWRHEIFPGYRSGRPPMPSVLREHLDDFRRVFADFGARSFVFPNMEADDVIATLACKVADRGGNALILSTDKIFLQLLSDRVEIR
ncbi:MAG: flap endonuclease Xni, partial [Deltaproteobacteria bacterium]|nr:flap endonuclease Xni [Deltaproteobacteria bacterium]